MKTIDTDVLVIGAGGAGSRAALEASRSGAKVAIAFKKTKRASGCTARAVSELSAYSAAFGYKDPRDKPHNHYLDTVNEGAGLADEALVKILCTQSPKCLEEVIEMGATFNMNEGRLDQLLADASTLPRAVNHGADTGRVILDTVIKQLENDNNVTFYENTSILRLLTSFGSVVGAFGVNTKSGELIIFKAKSTVLATGGGCYLYKLNGQPDDLTGTGYGMAYDIGANLVNMEMIQFGPAIIHPVKGYLLVTKYWRLKPRLYNKNGEEFLDKYVPDNLTAAEALRAKEFAFPFNLGNPGMYVDIAMHSEICAGRGSEHGGVYMDVSHNDPQTIENTVPVTFKWFLDRGIDIRRGPIEIAPVAQCYIGGIKVNSKTETNIPGLYCCGEAEGGVHGAARPGGNMLAATQVFGKIAGVEAAKRALPIEGVVMDEKQIEQIQECFNSILERKEGIEPDEVLKRIQSIMWRYVSIQREKDGMEQVLKELEEIKSKVLSKLKGGSLKNAILSFEMNDIVKTAQLVTKSALLREESRGSHYRTDHTQRNSDEWLKAIEIQGPGEGKISYRVPRRLNDFYVNE